MEVLEDNKLFKKLGFIENLDLSLNCSAKDFQKCFENNVNSWQVFVGVNGPNKKFQGKIGGNAFKLYKVFPSLLSAFVALSVLVLYLAIRSKVKKLTSEIERELSYWLTKL